jgi:hypothetical protein
VDIEDLVESNDLYQTQVSWSVYGDYIKAMGGYGILAFLILSFAVSVGIQSATTWFLSFWLMKGNGVSPFFKSLFLVLFEFFYTPLSSCEL